MSKLKKTTATLLIAIFMLPVFAVMCEAEEIDTAVDEIPEVIDILPVGKTFTYMTDDFQMNVSVPSNIGFSTSDIKEDNKLDVYFMPFSSLSGLFRVDVEAGIKVRLPLAALLFFVDIDTMILGKNRPDHFRFEWLILGIPSQAMSLGSGDIGVYSIAIPTMIGEGDLESLSVGEWSHIASYDLYSVMEPKLTAKLTAMGVETEDITIGSVMELERIENEEKEKDVEIEVEPVVDYYRNLYENLQKMYNSLLLNYTRLQDDLDEAKIDLSDIQSELSMVELELEEKRSELNKAYDKITMKDFQVTTLVAFATCISLIYIISKRGKVTPQVA